MKLPRIPERRISPLFGSVMFCSRKGHSLAIFAHTPSPDCPREICRRLSREIAEWQLARRSIGAGYAEVWPFCHSGFFDIQSISRTSPAGVRLPACPKRAAEEYSLVSTVIAAGPARNLNRQARSLPKTAGDFVYRETAPPFPTKRRLSWAPGAQHPFGRLGFPVWSRDQSASSAVTLIRNRDDGILIQCVQG